LQVQVNSANQLSCVVPSYDSGSYKVTVINTYGQESSDPVLFSYRPAPQVASISPRRGNAAGGGSLNLNGAGFVAGAVVKVGGQTCASPQIISQTQITCTIPNLPAGIHQVIVTNPEGQSSASVSYEAVSPQWVQTKGGACVSVCSQENLISKPSPEGAYCASGELIPGSTRGVIKFSNGCKLNRSCAAWGLVNGAVNVAQYCYGPKQIRNKEKTDITMGCYCGF
ncbi:MAG: IPT/TIG domain-containing protein, partial [Pseudomonadota bacterium]